MVSVPVYYTNTANRIGFFYTQVEMLNREFIEVALPVFHSLFDNDERNKVINLQEKMSFLLKPIRRDNRNFEIYRCFYPVLLTCDPAQFENNEQLLRATTIFKPETYNAI
jgi:hypothetical protein